MKGEKKPTQKGSRIYFASLIIYLLLSFWIRTSEWVLWMNYLSIAAGIFAILQQRVSLNGQQCNITATNFLLCVFLVVSVALSDTSQGMETTNGRLICTVTIAMHMTLSAILLSGHSSKKWEKLFYILCVAAIIGTLQFYQWSDLMAGLRGEVRLGKELIGINLYGITMAMLSLFAFYKGVTQKQFRTSHMLLFALLFLFSVTSGSRKAILSVLVGAPLFLLLNNRKSTGDMIVKIALVVAVALFLLSQLDFTRGLWQRLSTLWTESDVAVGESDEMRNQMIRKAVQGWWQSPLWGHGFNTFTVHGGFDTYSHCNYAEILFNTGLIGLLLTYGPRILLLIGYAKNVKRWYDPFASFIFTVAILITAFEYACVTYYEGIMNFYWWIAAAYFIKKQKETAV